MVALTPRGGERWDSAEVEPGRIVLRRGDTVQAFRLPDQARAARQWAVWDEPIARAPEEAPNPSPAPPVSEAVQGG